MLRELLIGCGSRRDKRLVSPGESEEWGDLTTLDINADHKPDVVWDLNVRPLPFADDTFDTIRAFDVLEHLGRQGDYRAFFDEWSEWWRLLKPGGIFYGISPHWSSAWAWLDPGHTRAMGPELFLFLSQPNYEVEVGYTPMSDYRFCFRADFDLIHSVVDGGAFQFGLRAIKPSRIKESVQWV
jgi:SAM-dependent methyltransferase